MAIKKSLTRKQVEFIAEAREAARMALFFLRQLEPSDPEGKIRWALASVKAKLEPVTPPEEGHDPIEYHGSAKSFQDVVNIWNRGKQGAREGCDASEGENLLKKAESLERELEVFLKESEVMHTAKLWTYVRFPAVRRVAGQHATFLVAVVAAALIALRLEIVNSLLRNNWWNTILAVVLWLTPVAVLQILAGRFRRYAFWDVGWRAFRVCSVFPLRFFTVVSQPEPWIPRVWDKKPYEVHLSWLFKALLLAVMWCMLFGLVPYIGVRDDVRGTVFFIIATLGCIMLAGATIDFFDFYSQIPFRRAMFIGIGLFLLLYFLSDIWWSWEPRYLATIVLLIWVVLAHIWAKRVEFGRDILLFWCFALPIVILTATTVFRSRAEAWTPHEGTSPAAVEWPFGGDSGDPVVVMAASGGGSRSAIYALKTLHELEMGHQDILENLHAISSVSGGSLANAIFVADRYRKWKGEEAVADSSPCHLPLVDRAKIDYLRPTLKGAAFFWRGRGKSIEQRWERCDVGLGNVTLAALTAAWRSPRNPPRNHPPFPMPLFNSASLDRSIVVLTPLQRKQYLFESFDKKSREENEYDKLSGDDLGLPTWVFYRSGIYGLDELVPGFDPKLSQAVRASASFPFGFPLVELKTDKPLFYSPREKDRRRGEEKWVRLTDGGALSNSGVVPLYHLLMANRKALVKRGVLMIVVDAGKMPEFHRPSRTVDLVGTMLDQNPKGEGLHRLMFDRLEGSFGECLKIVQVDLRPGEKFNVLTTWALDKSSLERVDQSFKAAWGDVDLGLDVLEKLQVAAKENRCGESRETAADRSTRVPLS